MFTDFLFVLDDGDTCFPPDEISSHSGFYSSYKDFQFARFDFQYSAPQKIDSHIEAIGDFKRESAAKDAADICP